MKNVSPAPSVQKEIASPDGAFDTDSVFAPTEHDYANESPVGGSSGDGHHRKDSSDADAEMHRQVLVDSLSFFLSVIKFR